MQVKDLKNQVHEISSHNNWNLIELFPDHWTAMNSGLFLYLDGSINKLPDHPDQIFPDIPSTMEKVQELAVMNGVFAVRGASTFEIVVKLRSSFFSRK